MLINPLLVVFAAVLLIFVIMVVPSWLYLRQVAMMSGVNETKDKIARLERDVVDYLSNVTAIQNRLNEVNAAYEMAKARDISTQETLRSLGNKFNSRARVERKNEAAATIEQEVPEEPVDLSKIGLPLFQSPEQAAQSLQPKRKFGERP